MTESRLTILVKNASLGIETKEIFSERRQLMWLVVKCIGIGIIILAFALVVIKIFLLLPGDSGDPPDGGNPTSGGGGDRDYGW